MDLFQSLDEWEDAVWSLLILPRRLWHAASWWWKKSKFPANWLVKKLHPGPLIGRNSQTNSVMRLKFSAASAPVLNIAPYTNTPGPGGGIHSCELEHYSSVNIEHVKHVESSQDTLHTRLIYCRLNLKHKNFILLMFRNGATMQHNQDQHDFLSKIKWHRGWGQGKKSPSRCFYVATNHNNYLKGSPHRTAQNWLFCQNHSVSAPLPLPPQIPADSIFEFQIYFLLVSIFTIKDFAIFNLFSLGSKAWLGSAPVLFKFSLDLNNLDNKGKLIYSTHDGTENQFWKWRRQTGI